MDEFGSSGEIPEPAASRPEVTGRGDTSGTGQDTSHSSSRDAAGSRGSGSDPDPAETLTRDQHADEMRDAPSVEQDDAPEPQNDAERDPQTDRAGAGTAAGELAEPRTREEVASEARTAAGGQPGQHDVGVVPDDDEARATRDAPAGTETPDAQHLAEPRSRQEAADEARAGPASRRTAQSPVPLPQAGMMARQRRPGTKPQHIRHRRTAAVN